MTKRYRFTDQIEFQVVDYNEESMAKVKDDYPGAFKPAPLGAEHPSGLGLVPGSSQQNDLANVAGRGLVIKVAATHAGLITRNNGFYLPDKMRTGAVTWTEHYQKPIQVHHEDHQDPVGRVLSARYVETVGMVTDRFRNHVLRDSLGKQVGTANGQFWQDFCSDGSFSNKLKQIKLMDSILNDPHYAGVGFIELTADITDPVAIQKVIDGRFLTGSVGAVSDKAVCSVCDTNWLEDEHCGHKPGRLYDGKKCFVVAGNLEYDEWSFVNTPADRHAAVIDNGQNGITDSKVEDNASRVLYFIPADLTNEEGSHMKDTAKEVKPAKADIKDAEGEQEDVEILDQTDVVNVTDNTEEDGSEETSGETISVEDNTTEANPAELLMDKLFVDSSTFTESDEEALYDLMMSTITEKDGVNLEETKLSTEARKKLPASVFCGPERSFPVIDAVHFTAAGRLVDSYKGPGDKTDIATKIERKGKALGFTVAAKDAAVANEVAGETLESQELHIALKHEYQGELSDEAKAKVAEAFLAQLVAELGEDALAQAVIAKKIAVSKDMLDLQVEETLKQEDAVGELRGQLSALRRELSATYDDVAQLEDSLIEKASEAREAKVERLKDLHKLDNSFNEETEANLATISDEALTSSLNSLLAKVDTVKIADKLTNGLSRTPDETVNNPAAVTEPSTTADIKDESNKRSMEAKPSFATQRMVDETYHHFFVTQRNPFKAKKYYTDQVNAGMAMADATKMFAHDDKED